MMIIYEEPLPREELIKIYKYISKLNKKYFKQITELQEENKELLDKVRDREKLIVENIQLKRDKIDKAIEIYKNKNTCKYKKQRFMEDKTTADLMYEAIKGSEE